MLRWSSLVAVALVAIAPAPLFAQPKPLAGAELKEYIRANYTKM